MHTGVDLLNKLGLEYVRFRVMVSNRVFGHGHVAGRWVMNGGAVGWLGRVLAGQLLVG